MESGTIGINLMRTKSIQFNNFNLYQEIWELLGELRMLFPVVSKQLKKVNKNKDDKLANHYNFIDIGIVPMLTHKNNNTPINPLILFTIYVYLFALRDLLLLFAYEYKIHSMVKLIQKRFSKSDIANSWFLMHWLQNIINNSLVELKKGRKEFKYVFVENYILTEQDEVTVDENTPTDTNANPTSNEDNGNNTDNPTTDINIVNNNEASSAEEQEISDILSDKPLSFGGGGGGSIDTLGGNAEGNTEGGNPSPDVLITISYLKKLVTLVSKMKLFAPPLVNDYLDNLLSYLDSVASYVYSKIGTELTDEDFTKISEYKAKLQYLLNLFKQTGIQLPQYQALQRLFSSS